MSRLARQHTKCYIAVLDENPEEVTRYLAGEEQLLQFFVGQLMKRTRGKAKAAVATTILKDITYQDSGTRVLANPVGVESTTWGEGEKPVWKVGDASTDKFA